MVGSSWFRAGLSRLPTPVRDAEERSFGHPGGRPSIGAFTDVEKVEAKDGEAIPFQVTVKVHFEIT